MSTTDSEVKLKEKDDIRTLRSEPGVRKPVRSRKVTEKAQNFWKDINFKELKAHVRKLQTLQNSVRNSLSDGSDIKTVRSCHSKWLKQYELLFDKRDEYVKFLTEIEIVTFESDLWDSVMAESRVFKDEVEQWVADATVRQQREQGLTEQENMRSRKGSVRSSKTGSRGALSSARLKERQLKVELETESAALVKMHKIRLAKLQLQLEEEELNLKTKIAIAQAKERIIEEEMESGSDFSERKSRRSDVPLLKTEKTRLGDTFTYDQEDKKSGSRESVTEQDMWKTSLEAVVRQMKKPPPDIQPFDGDPLKYRRFIRQFNSKIVVNSDDNDERMNYLEKYTVGAAHNIVAGYSVLDGDVGYPSALRALEERYGNDEHIASAFIEKGKNWKSIKADDPVSLDQYSIFLTECENSVRSIPALQILGNLDHMQQFARKLPYNYQEKWRNVVARKREQHVAVQFKDFSEFVRFEARKATDPIFGKDALKTPQTQIKPSAPKPNKEKERFHKSTTVATDVQVDKPVSQKDNSRSVPANTRWCVYCDSTRHDTQKCYKFKDLSVEDKLQFLRSKELCFKCLTSGHMAKGCLFDVSCDICKNRHQTFLHTDGIVNVKRQEKPSSSQTSPKHIASVCTDNNADCQSFAAKTGSEYCTLAIIPVKVRCKNSLTVVETYAFMDPGSSASFCTEELMRKLGAPSRKKKITLETMSDTHVLNTCEIKNIEVFDIEMKSEGLTIPTLYTKDSLPVSVTHVPTNEDISSWPHLQAVELPTINAGIGLLIGNNIPDAYAPLQVITGPRGSPHATQTQLGWVVWNVLRNGGEEEIAAVNRIDILAVEDSEGLKRLEHMYKRSQCIDFPETTVDELKALSREDEVFVRKVEESLLFKEGHYCIDLPFRKEDVKMPDNHAQALQRLQSLKTKMKKNPTFCKDYVDFMNKLIDKGYAVRVQESELKGESGKNWYIPHHGVYNELKPGKIRVVFDCAAVYQGTSLNSQLLSGPDLTNSLLGVLMRFRQENYAIMGDIESMFLQVRVPEQSQNFLRFYWWPDSNMDQTPAVFRMTVHLFGATSSPACANTALRRTAHDNKHTTQEEIASVVEKGFYVDDCLKSLESEEKAIDMIQEVSKLCQKGGFHISKWVSNSHRVMDTVSPDERAKGFQNLDLETNSLPSEKALGVYWQVEDDTLGFKVVQKNRSPTRRGILSVVSSVFDPLGLVSPFVLKAKILLQDLCRRDYSWDQVIENTELQKWEQWTAELPLIETIQVPRSHKPTGFGNVTDHQVHIFSDASEVGYGVAAYVRLTKEVGQVHCSLLLSKSRVAPLRKVTMPRMELTAATVAARLSKVILKELEYPDLKLKFWTDSTSVLRYLANEKTRFKTFFANRISKILSLSELNQWGYVSTSDNPADAASRGLSIHKLNSSTFWFQGPDFLNLDEKYWPIIPSSVQDCEDSADPEVKLNVNSTTIHSSSSAIDTLIGHYSSWGKLKRAVGWIMLVIQALKSKANSRRYSKGTHIHKQLSTEIIKKAETVLIKHIQGKHFNIELKVLTAQQSDPECRKTVKGSSAMFKLDPILKDGVIRVGGRLTRADMVFERKHQVILPSTSPVSMLILQEAHKCVGHMGKNAMFSHVRQKFWILGAGKLIKGIISKCVTCLKYKASSVQQKMSDLPEERLKADHPPFAYVGMDYFGPFYIKRARSTVKRYGVVFTCMSIRGIHLEIAHSLDTDSCVNAVRRFIARRGVPLVIRSDNGTNLVGCAKELRESLRGLNEKKVHSSLLNRGIDWRFNVPAASHHGGVWERMIRTVRKILFSILKEQTIKLDDEGLSTLMCEVEMIINNRPITEAQSSQSDLSPLTPNHLLLLRSGDAGFPPGTFTKEDLYSRRRWRQIQYLADIFWRRWKAEYLPLLQTRQRWLSGKRNMQIGDVVLLIDNTPRNSWSLGRVTQVVQDKRGFVRSVHVKTDTTELVRPVSKLVLLLCAEDDP